MISASSIILPCYNPPKGWAENVVQEYNAISDLLSHSPELIIVNDGSTNGISPADIQLLNDRIPSFRWLSYTDNKGKGSALRSGTEASASDIIIYTDIDFPYTNDSLKSLYSELKNDACDIAVGVKSAAYYERVPFARRVISKGLQGMIKFFFSIPFTDTQCGLKGFNRRGKQMFLKTSIDRYLFDLEFIRAAHKNKLRIKQVEIILNDDVEFRKMNVRVLAPELLNFITLMFKSPK